MCITAFCNSLSCIPKEEALKILAFSGYLETELNATSENFS